MSLEDPTVAKPVEEVEEEEDDDDESSEDGSSDDDDDDDDSKEDDDDDSKEDDDDDDSKDEDDEDSKEDDDDDDSKEDDDEPIAVPVVVPKPIVPAPTLNRQPPKMRIKLSLKLPTKANAAAAAKKADPSSDGDAVATVIHDDDDDEDDKKGKTTAVAVAATSSSTATKTQKSATKRRSAHPSRPIRLPPIASPGLLMAPPSQGNSKTNNNGNTNSIPVEPVTNTAGGLVAPNAVFGSSMSAAGYTLEDRTKTPHRGSSVTRTVGDLFDSNVKLTLHFPPLLKQEYLEKNVANTGQSPAEMLLASLSHHIKPNRGKKRPRSFEDMVPVSLTIPYPESFLEKRVKYVDEVENREQKIVLFQEAQEEEEEEASTETTKKNSVVIPPIPKPPEPPTLQELEGFSSSVNTAAATSTSATSSLSMTSGYAEDKHPIYLPRKKEFCAHLDPECFHVTEGRYFGLLSNFVADPNYVGANAPGISGVHASGGAGLATSTAGSGTGGVALTVSASYHQGTALSKSDKKKMAASPMLLMMDRSSHGQASSLGPSLSNHNGEGSEDSSPSSTTMKPKRLGPKPTATAADLRRIMDEGGDTAEAIRTCITRAAVHASRSGRHGQSFLTPNGETYPDVSKAFAAHAEIKPCQRCKGNKQGAYHCRLRRRHKDPDYDGGNSLAALEPLFTAPMESLLCGGKRSDGSSK